MESSPPKAPLMRARDLSEELSDAPKGFFQDLDDPTQPEQHSQQLQELPEPRHAVPGDDSVSEGEDTRPPNPSLNTDPEVSSPRAPLQRRHAHLVSMARAALRLLDEAEQDQDPYQQHEQSDADNEDSSSCGHDTDMGGSDEDSDTPSSDNSDDEVGDDMEDSAEMQQEDEVENPVLSDAQKMEVCRRWYRKHAKELGVRNPFESDERRM